ncbi:ATP phosphoribosyltransferase regulatory subunit [Sporosarcina sp. ACRSL]|uniref:ATP phosphoribosyltransferase regulatory subunit n=1 Tax=Sporosarcina sp. ACRSL TaxID=2918215 RepID=UPI001EF6A74E|nr:ATP phosphoribosyltransferase regulatory subunit [Sporosarcina sp. ACRSL]MCG7344556.1 ATP phosphoribosyltransferase regulatory subunit [Sporosarcina sp. ACRSL]
MNLDLKEVEQFEQTVRSLSKRFSTYGFQRIKTPAFERYDLYSKVTSSVNRKEMVKVIDPSGEVFVLRPDVTIPITQELSHAHRKLTSEHRFYYIQEVFRRSSDPSEKIERTQAGIEYFTEKSPEADAETISLALQTMKDLEFDNIKIEIGHSAFFDEMIGQLPLTENELDQLKALIQAKNSVEIALFLENVEAPSDMKHAISQIPNLYGKPREVLKRAEQVSSTPRMQETLSYIAEVCRGLASYGFEDDIVLDFGLINRMDYYSGILFQGYVGRFGKPVLMGGRYDRLGHEFGADLPAVGFACEIETLLKASDNQRLFER